MTLNLASVGNGLLQTHVGWDDIEQCIQKERKINVSFGPNKRLVQTGVGNGFLSRIGIVDADFQGERDGLPNRFLVKILTFLESMEFAQSVAEREGIDVQEMMDSYEEGAREYHNREVNVLRAFSRFDNSLTKLPKYYFSQEFDETNKLKGFIGMEFIENAELRHFYHNVTPEELSDMLHALAYLQAKSLELTDSEKEKFLTNPLPKAYEVTMPLSVVKKAVHDMYVESEELRPSGEMLEKMIDELFNPNLTSTMNEELGMKDVYAHGDLWSTNILWIKTDDGVKFSRLIDHQFSHYGCAAEDLCRVFISTLSGKDRRENWERLLEDFYTQLVQYCDGELPYTLEQLKEAYRRMFPLAGLLLSDIFESIMKIATVNLSDEEKAAAKEVVSEKVLALFGDIVSFAVQNKKNLASSKKSK